MKFINFFIISVSITSFFATSVLSKSFSLCLESHRETININKKHEIEKSSCHTSAKEEKNKPLCLECDCHLTQVLLNKSFTASILNIAKFNFDKLVISKYSTNKKVKDPPPKRIS